VLSGGVLRSTTMDQAMWNDSERPLSYIQITQSSGLKLGIREHRISKAIAALGREQDLLLSKLLSARQRILNLEGERQMITDAIAVKEAKAMRPGDAQQVMAESVMEDHLVCHEMRSPSYSAIQSNLNPLAEEFVPSPSRSPEPGSSQDIRLSEIIKDCNNLLNDLEFQSDGTMGPLVLESQEELIRSL
jgi:hypothetical protein